MFYGDVDGVAVDADTVRSTGRLDDATGSVTIDLRTRTVGDGTERARWVLRNYTASGARTAS